MVLLDLDEIVRHGERNVDINTWHVVVVGQMGLVYTPDLERFLGTACTQVLMQSSTTGSQLADGSIAFSLLHRPVQMQSSNCVALSAPRIQIN